MNTDVPDGAEGSRQLAQPEKSSHTVLASLEGVNEAQWKYMPGRGISYEVRMKLPYLVVLALYLTGVIEGQRAPYDEGRWQLLKERGVDFAEGSPPSRVLLLRSRKTTGSGGGGQPMNDVEVLVLRGDTIIYGYTNQSPRPRDYFRDDYLEIRDVTGDGRPEILFHSGTEGASDASKVEHVLHYDVRTGFVTDIAPGEFYQSGTHGLRWLTSLGREFAVIATRHWKAATPLEDRCHYCPSPFQYDLLGWNQEKRAFTVDRRLRGKKAYEEASLAMDGDWEIIQRAAH